MPNNVLNIAAACLLDDAGRLLVVRKLGSHIFMLPGGKVEIGETPLQTLRRELQEELSLITEESQLQLLGHFQALAANEPDHWVKADVFVGRLAEKVQAQAEIEALDWLTPQTPHRIRLAPLLRQQVIPALLQRLGSEEY